MEKGVGVGVGGGFGEEGSFEGVFGKVLGEEGFGVELVDAVDGERQ